MSIEHAVTDLTLCIVSIICVMYWFESRSRTLFRIRAESLMSELDRRAESQEKERLVQTEKIAVLARSLTLQLENNSTHVARIEVALEYLISKSTETKFIERIHNED